MAIRKPEILKFEFRENYNLSIQKIADRNSEIGMPEVRIKQQKKRVYESCNVEQIESSESGGTSGPEMGEPIGACHRAPPLRS